MSHQVLDAPITHAAPRRPAPPQPAVAAARVKVGPVPEREVDFVALAIVVLGAVGAIMVGLAVLVGVCRALIQVLPAGGGLLTGGVYVLLPALGLIIAGAAALHLRDR